MRDLARMTSWNSVVGESLPPVDLSLYNRLFLILNLDFSLTSDLSSWLRLGPVGQGASFTRQSMIREMAGSFACSWCQSIMSPIEEDSIKSGTTASSKVHDSTAQESVVTFRHRAWTTGWETCWIFCGQEILERASAFVLEGPEGLIMSHSYIHYTIHSTHFSFIILFIHSSCYSFTHHTIHSLIILFIH